MGAFGARIVVTMLALGACGCGLGGGNDDVADENACPAPEKPFVRQAWTTDDSIEAIAVHCGTIYVAGAFESIGPRTGPFVSVSASGRVLEGPAFEPPPRRKDGSTPPARVTSVASDSQGGWYVAGAFGVVGDRPCPGVAHILRSGALDVSMCLHTDGVVRTMALAGEALYLGGDFARVSGRPRSGLAAVDTRTGAVLAWAPKLDERTVCDDRECITQASVNAISATEDAVYVGGFFNGIDGVARTHVAALDRDTGTVLDFDARLRAEEDYFGGVEALAALDGIVYVSCPFCNETSADEPLHRLDAESGRPAGPPITIDDPVRALAVYESTIYAGGSFRRIAGTRRSGVAAFDASTGTLLPWKVSTLPTGTSVSAIARAGAAVHLGTAGEAESPDPNAHVSAFRVLTVEAETGRARSEGVAVNGPIVAMGASGRSLVIGGEFSGAGIAKRDGLAAIDGALGVVLDWAPRTGRARWEHPRSLLVAGGRLYVGGSITQIDGAGRSGLASFDLTTRKVTPWDPVVGDIGDPFFDGVVTLTAYGETIYVGGDFTRINDVSLLGAAAIDSESGEVLDWDPRVGAQPGPRIELGAVRALATDDGRVYLGGGFEDVAGSPRAGLAAVGDSSAELLSWDPSPNERVETVTPSELGLYVGGWFEDIGSSSRNALALLERDTGSATDFDAHIGGELGELLAILETNGMLFVAGDFEVVDGELRPGIAALDPASGRLLDWTLGADGDACAPSSLAAGGGALIVDGYIDGCGNYESGNVEQLVVQPLTATS